MRDEARLLTIVIDDNPADVDLLMMSFEQEPPWKLDVVVADDGERAIALLGEFAKGKRERMPDFIVLDLNIPRRDGAEVLNAIRGLKALEGVPVAVLSSSPSDVIRLKLTRAGVGADGYFTKPLDIDEFLKMGVRLREWFEGQTPTHLAC